LLNTGFHNLWYRGPRRVDENGQTDHWIPRAGRAPLEGYTSTLCLKKVTTF